jgi:hypothetical protein
MQLSETPVSVGLMPVIATSPRSVQSGAGLRLMTSKNSVSYSNLPPSRRRRMGWKLGLSGCHSTSATPPSEPTLPTRQRFRVYPATMLSCGVVDVSNEWDRPLMVELVFLKVARGEY